MLLMPTGKAALGSTTQQMEDQLLDGCVTAACCKWFLMHAVGSGTVPLL